MNKLDPFEELISKKLQEHRVDFSYDSWNAIEKKLPKAKPNTFSAVAIGVIIISAATFFILNYNQNSSAEITNPILNKELPVEETQDTKNNEPSLKTNENSSNSTLNKPVISLKPHNNIKKTFTNEPIETKGETITYKENEPEPQTIYLPNLKNEEIESPAYFTELDSSQIPAISIPIAEFIVSNNVICCSESIEFSPEEEENSSYFWDFDDGSTSSDTYPTHQYSEPGNYNVTLRITKNNLVSPISQPFEITVLDNPSADFNFEHLVENGIPSILFSAENLTTNSLQWSFGDGTNSSSNNEIHSYSKKGVYFVSLEKINANNCVSTITKPIEILEDFNLFAPNSFTPDGDGVNDTFIPESLKLMNVDFVMNIYNKQGKIIFETKNINQPWDGINQNSGQKCNQGSYIWIVQLVNNKGQAEHFKGALLLLN